MYAVTVSTSVSAVAVSVIGAAALLLCSVGGRGVGAAPTPELVIAEPLFYPHGRSNSNQPQQQQKAQTASQSSYVPQVVKPPASMNMDMDMNRPRTQKQQQQYSGSPSSGYSGSGPVPSSFRRGAPFGDWGNDFVQPQSQSQSRYRDGDRNQEREREWDRDMERDRDNRVGSGLTTSGARTGNYPTLSSLSGYNSKRNQYQNQNSKLLIAKPLYHPSDKQGAKLLIAGGEGRQRQQEAQASVNSASSSSPSTSSNHVNVEAAEHGAIEIPEMGGIEYYDLINHIRSWTGALVDATVKAPGNVATAAQTVVRGSSNLLAQVRENMPDIQLPELPLPFAIPSLTSLIPDLTQGEDSYVAASQLAPLSPFPDFIGTFLNSKKRPPVESHWLDNYGV